MERTVDRISVEQHEILVGFAAAHVEPGGVVAARADARQRLSRSQDIRFDEHRRRSQVAVGDA
jgi:hypothetical protein